MQAPHQGAAGRIPETTGARSLLGAWFPFFARSQCRAGAGYVGAGRVQGRRQPGFKCRQVQEHWAPPPAIAPVCPLPLSRLVSFLLICSQQHTPTTLSPTMSQHALASLYPYSRLNIFSSSRSVWNPVLVQSPWTLLDGAQGPSINPCRSPFCASNGIIIQVSASFVLTTLSFQRSCESTLSAALGAHTRGDGRRTQRAPLSYEFSSAVIISANSASGIAVSHSPNEVRHHCHFDCGCCHY